MSLWSYTALYLILARVVPQCISECHVTVESPWPMPHILVPKMSLVEIHCTLNSQLTPYWLIDLANDSITSDLLFFNRREQLNDYGVYELPSIETPGLPPTLRVLINNTARNNGTVIECVGDRDSGSHKSAVLVYELRHPSIQVTEMSLQAMNISWSQVPRVVATTNVNQTYSLRVSHGSQSRTIPLSQPHYYFTAPKDAPPCEIYNFSITTTFDIVGTTYTGAGCSEPSPVLSRMLPQLPDIDKVESSLTYSLTKQTNGGIVLHVSLSLLLPIYCPTHIYTLVINGSSNESESYQQKLTVVESTMVASVTSDNLQDNAVLDFKILVKNTLGGSYDETGVTNFYTTDVQNVTVMVSDDNDSANKSVTVQCGFIPGSDARGCVVVLVGRYENTTVNLTRVDSSSLCVIDILSLTTVITVSDVFGFDIESDGSVGTLPVPGMLTTTNSKEFNALCEPNQVKPLPLLSTHSIVLIASVSGGVMVIVLLAVIVITFIIFISQHFKKSLTSLQPSQPPAAMNRYNMMPEGMDVEDSQSREIMPYYEQPENIHPNRKGSSLTQTSSNNYSESHYSKTSHNLQVSPTLSRDSDSTTYSRLQDSEEHTYHVLENNRPPCGVEVAATNFSYPGSNQTSQPSDLTPIYHDVQDVRPVEEQLYNQDPLSPMPLSDDLPQETGPIYQDIAELSVSVNTGTTITESNGPLQSDFSPTIVRITV